MNKRIITIMITLCLLVSGCTSTKEMPEITGFDGMEIDGYYYLANDIFFKGSDGQLLQMNDAFEPSKTISFEGCDINGILYYKQHYYIHAGIHDSWDSRIYKSKDLNEWELIYSSDKDRISYMRVLSDRLYMVEGMTEFTSIDGVNWEKVILDGEEAGDLLDFNMIKIDGEYVYQNPEWMVSELYTSKDGVNFVSSKEMNDLLPERTLRVVTNSDDYLGFLEGLRGVQLSTDGKKWYVFEGLIYMNAVFTSYGDTLFIYDGDKLQAIRDLEVVGEWDLVNEGNLYDMFITEDVLMISVDDVYKAYKIEH